MSGLYSTCVVCLNVGKHSIPLVREENSIPGRKASKMDPQLEKRLLGIVVLPPS